MILQGLPTVLCENLKIKAAKYKNCLYLPIKMIDCASVRVPPEFSFLDEAVDICLTSTDIKNRYVYLSYECSYVVEGKSQKRPGLHSDGFLTDDVNFIYYDKDPTVFYKTKFVAPRDHSKAIEEFEIQANENDEVRYPIHSLLMLDQSMIHRTSTPSIRGWRTFMKISVSKDKYNLAGNSHNSLFDYSWKKYERQKVRNHPIFKEVDSVNDELWEKLA